MGDGGLSASDDIQALIAQCTSKELEAIVQSLDMPGKSTDAEASAEAGAAGQPRQVDDASVKEAVGNVVRNSLKEGMATYEKIVAAQQTAGGAEPPVPTIVAPSEANRLE